MFPPPLLVFDRDGEVYAFRSRDTALAVLDVLGILDGEYEAAFTPDGHVVAIRPLESPSIEVTAVVDRELLALLLEAAAARRGVPWPDDDPLAIVALLLHEDWERRWPRRPRWLSRRLHGEEPPSGL